MTSDQPQPRDAAGIEPRDRTDGPEREPAGTLDGKPINAHETAPEEAAPRPDVRGGGSERHPEAVDDEPGSDL